MSDVTLMVNAISNGNHGAPEDLMPLVYEDLQRLAAARISHETAGHTLQPTDLVHEACLRLLSNGGRSWQNRAHFFGAAAEAMRRILIERARRKSRLKRGAGIVPMEISELEIAAAPPDDRVLLVDEALAQLKAEDPERARVVMLKFFGGLTNDDIAETLGVNERTVRRQWTFAKAWLHDRIRQEL